MKLVLMKNFSESLEKIIHFNDKGWQKK